MQNKITLFAKNTSPDHLNDLVNKIGLSKYAIAKSLIIDYSHFIAYFRDKDKKSARNCPYHTQLVLEFLAKGYRL